MKRLTEWIGTAVSLCCESFLGMPQNCDCEDCQREATNRLFAIENILGDEYDLDRLRELAQADREGRVEIIEPDVYECIKVVRKAQAALRREQDE